MVFFNNICSTISEKNEPHITTQFDVLAKYVASVHTVTRVNHKASLFGSFLTATGHKDKS